MEVVDTSPEYPLSASLLTDMVAATRRYRHVVSAVRGWLLVARLPPRLSGSELRYRRAYDHSPQPARYEAVGLVLGHEWAGMMQ